MSNWKPDRRYKQQQNKNDQKRSKNDPKKTQKNDLKTFQKRSKNERFIFFKITILQC